MPNFDKTGPMGKGAGTGRKMGRCFSGNENPENNSDELFRGQGRGFRGRGRGCRRNRRGFGGRQGFGQGNRDQ